MSEFIIEQIHDHQVLSENMIIKYKKVTSILCMLSSFYNANHCTVDEMKCNVLLIYFLHFSVHIFPFFIIHLHTLRLTLHYTKACYISVRLSFVYNDVKFPLIPHKISVLKFLFYAVHVYFCPFHCL